MGFKTFATLLVCGCSASSPNITPPDSASIPVVPDAPAPPDADVIPAPHYQYVMDRLDVPTKPTEVQAWSIDGTHNAIGQLFALISHTGFDITTTTDNAINRGLISTLIDLQVADFTTAPMVGVRMLRGSDPVPAACGISTDANCRHQFAGTAQFQIAADDPHTAAFTGAIAAGTLTTTSGDFSLQLSLGVAQLLDLSITDAHLKLIDASATAIGASDPSASGAVLSGAVRPSDMVTFLSQFALAAQQMVTRDCSGPATSANTCGCTAGTAGAEVRQFLDTNNDCKITLAELQSNSVFTSVLTPDTTLADQSLAVSVGFGMHAVPATFTLPQ